MFNFGEVGTLTKYEAARSHMSPRGVNPVVPLRKDVYANSAEYKEFLKRLTVSCNREFPISISEGIEANFNRVLSVPGMMSKPIPYPGIIKREKNSSKGEKEWADYSIIHEAICKFYFNQQPTFENIHVEEERNIGWPSLSKGGKMEEISNFLRNPSDMFNIVGGDIKSMLGKEVFPFFKNWYRTQPASSKTTINGVDVPFLNQKNVLIQRVEKDGFDWNGNRVKLLLNLDDPWNAMRTRLVYGGNWKLNLIILIAIKPKTKSFKQSLYPIFFDGNEEQFLKIIYDFLGEGEVDSEIGDVKQYDNQVRVFMAENFLKGLTMMNKSVGKAYEKMRFAPTLCTNQITGEIGITHSDYLETVHRDIGLPSGVASVTEEGLIGGLALVLYITSKAFDIQIDESWSVIKTVDELKKRRIFLLSSGDNYGFIARKGSKDLESIRRIISDMEFFRVEKSYTYKGKLIYSNNDGILQIKQSLVSYISNLVNAEKSYTDKKYPAYGYMLRKDIFKTHPYFNIADEILQSNYKDIFGQTLDDQNRDQFNQEKAELGNLNLDTVLYMDKPERLHYMDLKVDERLIKYIPASQVAKFYNTHVEEVKWA